MFKMLGDIANAMKAAQQMSGKMQGLSEQLRAKKTTGASGGGMIEVEMNGLGEMLGIKIDPSLIADGEIEMLEQLIPAAVNQANAKAKQLHAEAMQEMTSGMDVPGLNEALSNLSGGGTPPTS